MKVVNVKALINREYPNEVLAVLYLANAGEGGLTIRIESEGQVMVKLILDRSGLGVFLRAIGDTLIEGGSG